MFFRVLQTLGGGTAKWFHYLAKVFVGGVATVSFEKPGETRLWKVELSLTRFYSMYIPGGSKGCLFEAFKY